MDKHDYAGPLALVSLNVQLSCRPRNAELRHALPEVLRPLGNWWDNENVNGLVCLGTCSPENPVLFMGKSMVSGEDFPTQTDPLKMMQA